MEKGPRPSEVSLSEAVFSPEKANEWLISTAEDFINVATAQANLDHLKEQLPTFVDRFQGHKIEQPLKEGADKGYDQEEYTKVYKRITEVYDNVFYKPVYEWQKQWEATRPDTMGSVLVRSSSKSKQALVASLAQGLDVDIHFPLEDAIDLELLERQRGKESIFAQTYDLQDKYSPDWTPWHIVRTKSIDYSRFQRREQLSEPVLAMDTTVVVNNTVYNKPERVEEARYNLSTFSGQELTVLTGYNFLMTTHSGELISSPGGTAIKLPLRKFSHKEVEDLLALDGYNYMEVNAGVNVTHPGFQSLIRDDEPIRVMPFSFGLTVPLSQSISFNTADYIEEGMPVDKDTLPLLKPYFLGVPSHAIKQLLKEAPKMYEEVV